MKKRGLMIICLVLVGIAALFIFERAKEREPVYRGQTLTQWLQAMRSRAPDNEKEKEAIRQIGKKAVPSLVRMLQSADSPTKLKVRALLNKQHLIPISAPIDHQSLHHMAGSGFEALGPDAESAVPELIKLTNNRDPEIRSIAVVSLGKIGPDARPAIPLLIKKLNDEDYGVSSFAVFALAEIGEQPELVIPALVNALRTNPNFVGLQGADAIDSIGSFSNHSTNVVPALKDLLKSTSNGDLRIKIESTLSQIDSSAAPKGQQ